MSDDINYLQEARRIANAANLIVSGSEPEYRVYRKTALKPVFLGKRATPVALWSFVKRCAASA